MKDFSTPKGQIRLYNVMFPVWMFFMLPTPLWLFILPFNFAVDSLVELLAMKKYGYEDKTKVWKRSILPVWIIGFLCDFIGSILVFGVYMLLDEVLTFNELHTPPFEQLIVLPGVVLAGVLIYFLNRRFSFRKTGLTAEQIHKLSLALAIFTAPYTMLIPLRWIYW